MDQPKSRMNVYRIGFAAACFYLMIGTGVFAQGEAQRTSQQIAEFLRTAVRTAPDAAAEPGENAEPPRTSFTRNGHLRYVGAPPRKHFPAPATVAGPPEFVARQFLI